MSEQAVQTPVAETTTQPVTQTQTAQTTEVTQSPAATTVTEIKYLVDGSGRFVDGFEKILPDDIRDHSAIKKHTNIADLFKAKIGAESLIGKKVSEYLDSDNPAVVAERNKHFGVPEKPDGYKIDVKVPEGFQIKDGNIENFREFAHKIGLPAKYAEQLAQYETDLWIKNAENMAAESEQQKTATESALREEWKGDSYEKNIRSIKNLVTKEFGLTEADLSLPIGNNPALLKALASKVIPAFGEDRLIEGGMTQTFSSAEAQLEALTRKMISTPNNSPEYGELIQQKKTLLSKIK